MKKLVIKSDGFNKDKIISNGVKYIIGNGYLGYRGTLDEMEKEDCVGLNLPNFYDQVGDNWVDSINAFNPLYTVVYVNNEKLDIKTSIIKKHTHELNILTGIFKRKTIFNVQNVDVTITSQRFASIIDYHYLCSNFSVKANKSVIIEILTGIDTNVWDLHGQHLIDIKTDEDCVYGYTSKNHNLVKVIEKIEDNVPSKKEMINGKYLTSIKLNLKKGKTYTFKKVCYIDYNCDVNCNNNNNYDTYKHCYLRHLNQMKELWKINLVKIKSNKEANIGINYSIYQLMINALKDAKNISVPARGLSSQVYKGAIFWDTEIFMLPFYLNTNLNMAKSIIRYRIDSLKEAKLKAKEFNKDGAFYAWESIENGFDACSLYNVTDAVTNKPIRTYFKDKQIHISGDVVYGLCKYYERTNDDDIFIDGGLELLYEVCKFYLSCTELEEDRYVINDVIGPDEYHERINNNAYTNRLIKFCFDKCLEFTDYFIIKNKAFVKSVIIKTNIDIEQLKKVNKKLFIYESKDKVIEQFSGYFNLEDVNKEQFFKRITNKNEYLGGKLGKATSTQIIKQADVITMLYLFKEDYNIEELESNFNYYEPRTEHGSSLSASMYSLIASQIGNPEYAYPYFIKSATIDLTGNAKEYAGGIYIGGSHMASCGGAYISLIYGFCGLEIDTINDNIKLNPRLPDKLKKIKFSLVYKNKIYNFIVKNNKVKVRKK